MKHTVQGWEYSLWFIGVNTKSFTEPSSCLDAVKTFCQNPVGDICDACRLCMLSCNAIIEGSWINLPFKFTLLMGSCVKWSCQRFRQWNSILTRYLYLAFFSLSKIFVTAITTKHLFVVLSHCEISCVLVSFFLWWAWHTLNEFYFGDLQIIGGKWNNDGRNL